MTNSVKSGFLLCIFLMQVFFSSSCNFSAGSGINSGNQIILYGEYNNEEFGSSLDFIGDVNADGTGDIAVGAPSNELLGANSGMVYIFFGPFDPNQKTRTPDMRISGFPGSRFGTSISGGFDINGDSISDFAVSSEKSQFGSNQNGDLFVYFGSANDFMIKQEPVNGLELSGTVVYGADSIAGNLNSKGFGSFVRQIGDFDRDGFNDFGVSAPLSDYSGALGSGALFVFLTGRAISSPGRMDSSVADYIFVGNEDGQSFGFSFDYALNLDGQGNAQQEFSDDIIVGAPGSSKTFVFLGPSSRYLNGIVTPQFADRILEGKQGDYNFGYSVTHISDIDGDGLDDMAVSSKNSDDDRIYVFYGRNSQAPLSDFSLIIKGGFLSDSGVYITSFEGSAGPNLSIGAPLGGESGYSNGAIFFMLEEEFANYPKYVETELNVLNLHKKISNPMGLSPNSGYASTMRGSFDINADTAQDLLVGSPQSDINGENSGFAVLYF